MKGSLIVRPRCGHDHPIPPDRMTEPCSHFFEEYGDILQFIHDVEDKLEYRSDWIHERVTGPHGLPKGAAERIYSEIGFLLEMIHCREVDNFLSFLSELLALTFRTRPETLRSTSETVKVEMVVSHGTMETLIASLADHKVNQLSYQGMGELSGYLGERLGFEVFEEAQDLERAVGIIELRNIIVHNRGRVSLRYLDRVPGSAAKPGERLELDAGDVFDDIDFLAEAAVDVEVRASQKFDLPCPITRPY